MGGGRRRMMAETAPGYPSPYTPSCAVTKKLGIGTAPTSHDTRSSARSGRINSYHLFPDLTGLAKMATMRQLLELAAKDV